jgi:hypothetical protein
LDNMFTRPFFAYIDSSGNSYKPFVLPQKDPEYYNVLFGNYNRPELITGKIDINDVEMRDFIYSESTPINFDTTIDVDALSGATRIHKK